MFFSESKLRDEAHAFVYYRKHFLKLLSPEMCSGQCIAFLPGKKVYESF